VGTHTVHHAKRQTAAMLSQRLGILDQPDMRAAEVTPHRLVSGSTVIRLAIVNDYALVVAGVGALLTNEHIEVVKAPLPDFTDVDIVLIDPNGPGCGWPVEVANGGRGCAAKVVAYSWRLSPELIDAALTGGAVGCLSKTLTGSEIAAALKRIAGGEILVLAKGTENRPTATDYALERLSPREAEVMALIAQGSSNIQIADRLYVSINSVKAYIRSAYRKIGVERRTQAMLWGLEHGLRPDAATNESPPQGCGWQHFAGDSNAGSALRTGTHPGEGP
jgi:two-component system, NarL family, response regulator LiaR